MQIRTTSVGPWAMNAYVLICPNTQASVLIDPGAEPHKLVELLEGTDPKAILITHAHMDHVGALDQMRKELNVPVLAHLGRNGSSGLKVDQWLHGDERLPVGDQIVVVYSTPGHADDQVSFGAQDGTIFVVGDTIFEGGPGKTWSVQGFQSTLDTLRNVVLTWPDHAMCYPGHGKAFRLGEIRSAIQHFVDQDHGHFFGDAQW